MTTAEAITNQIAGILGDPWRASTGDWTPAPPIVMNPVKGYVIVVQPIEHGRRFAIIGRRLSGTPGGEHHVTVAADITGPRLAATITRFVGPYAADFDRGSALLAQRVDNWQARVDAADRLAGLIPGAEITPDRLYLRWDEEQLGKGRITFGTGPDGTVALRVEGLPVEACAAMLDALVAGVS